MFLLKSAGSTDYFIWYKYCLIGGVNAQYPTMCFIFIIFVTTGFGRVLANTDEKQFYNEDHLSFYVYPSKKFLLSERGQVSLAFTFRKTLSSESRQYGMDLVKDITPFMLAKHNLFKSNSKNLEKTLLSFLNSYFAENFFSNIRIHHKRKDKNSLTEIKNN